MIKKISVILCFAFLLSFAGNNRAQTVGPMYLVTVQVSGNVAGEIISSPPGINCGQKMNACSARFERGTPITLRPRLLNAGAFHGWNLAVGSTQPCSASYGDCNFILMENSTIRGEFVAH
jgi:hypothetical protein